MTGLVHTHGPTEGRGLDCPERLVDGQLRGACITGRPSDNSTGDPVVHLVRAGRYPHVVVHGMRTSVRQSQALDEVTCAECLAEAERFLDRSGATR